MTEMEKLIINY